MTMQKQDNIKMVKACYNNIKNGILTPYESVDKAKAIIEKCMGENYEDYFTAWIYESNTIGRLVYSYYFSIKDKKWHKQKFKITSPASWNNARPPYKQIAWSLLSLLGYVKRENNEISKIISQHN